MCMLHGCFIQSYSDPRLFHKENFINSAYLIGYIFKVVQSHPIGQDSSQDPPPTERPQQRNGAQLLFIFK